MYMLQQEQVIYQIPNLENSYGAVNVSLRQGKMLVG
jgi:hypothetical protein